MRIEPQLLKLIAARFPGVRDFEFDHFAERVQPVEYNKGRNRKIEFPPVAKWKVANRSYAYVFKPTFKIERWQILCFDVETVRPDYAAEEVLLFKCLQWSIDGKEAAEINCLLGHRGE